MPKIIEANKDSIILIVKNLIQEKRYNELNCRQIAKIANISSGTLYHFFSSKMEMIAYVLLDDWNKTIHQIQTQVPLKEGLKNIYDGISSFSKNYYSLWEYSKQNSFEYVSYLSKHSLLINQIQEVLLKIINYNNLTIDNDILEFISETILSYSTRLIDYHKIEKIFIKLIGGAN